jgi:eukaryotic-like serine/threonine-protein kinase
MLVSLRDMFCKQANELRSRIPGLHDPPWTEALRRLKEDPEPPSKVAPEIGEDWNSVILRCLERDPASRLSSAQEVLNSLQRNANLQGDLRVKSKPRVKKWMWALAALTAGVLTVLFAMVFRIHSVSALTPKDVVVLTDFTNNTGEPIFDGTLKEALAIDLEQSPLLNILPDSKVAQTLKLMGRQSGDRLTPEVAREICIRTGSRATIAGAITRLGNRYAIQLKATVCQTGDVLGASAAEADSRDNTLQALGSAAGVLRSKVGESLASVQRFDKPLVEATTSSLEALQAYSAGVRPVRNKTAEESIAERIQFFERAVKLDPNFALAYARLGLQYGNLNQRRLLVENLRKAYELRDRVTEREAYDISGLYYANATGEVFKAIQQYQLCVQEYPNYVLAYGNLGSNYLFLGQYDDAAREIREGLRVTESLGSKPLSSSLVYPYIALNRLDEAEALLDQDLSRFPKDPLLHFSLYLLAFVRNDEATMTRESAWAKASPSPEVLFAVLESGIEVSRGRLRRALVIFHAPPKEYAASANAADAGLLADFGYAKEARSMALRALAEGATPSSPLLFDPGSASGVAALALARAGDIADAQKAAKTLDQEAPLDTFVQNFWLPTIRAEIEIANGHPAKAIDLLRDAKPYDLIETGAMASIYTRGRAYLALGDGSSAAQEFENMLNPAHNQAEWMRFPKALAYLGLARARSLEARSATGPATKAARGQALIAYQNFFTLWKDADPDIPILRQARGEYAKLMGN